jgi:hypothetical protein
MPAKRKLLATAAVLRCASVHKSETGGILNQLRAVRPFTGWPDRPDPSELTASGYGKLHDCLDSYLAAWIASLAEAERQPLGDPPFDAICVPREHEAGKHTVDLASLQHPDGSLGRAAHSQDICAPPRTGTSGKRCSSRRCLTLELTGIRRRDPVHHFEDQLADPHAGSENDLIRPEVDQSSVWTRTGCPTSTR